MRPTEMSSRVATADRRVLVTLDKDFGELAVRSGISSGSGIVLLSLGGSNPEADNARAIAAITSRDDWTGHFSVITDDRVRVRSLRQHRG